MHNPFYLTSLYIKVKYHSLTYSEIWTSQKQKTYELEVFKSGSANAL